jgi:3-mercaptopyruvate sulfurtransferase SseA
MAQSPLVSTAWLGDHLNDPDLRIVEVCSLRDDKTYHEGHIPGAMWVYWKSACWHDSDRDFVTPAAMAELFGEMGIGPSPPTERKPLPHHHTAALNHTAAAAETPAPGLRAPHP